MPQRTSAERKARQQRKRDAERAKQAAARESWQRAEDARHEALAEDRAPAAQRNAVEGTTAAIRRAAHNKQRENAQPLSEPAAAVLRGPTVVPNRQTGGYRRANPLVAMKAHGTAITAWHIRYAKKLRDDHDLGVVGARITRATTTPWDGSQGQAGEFPWLDAVGRYNRALDAVGPQLRGIVHAIAVEWRSAEEIGRAIGKTEQVTVGQIVAGLDRLVEHYEPGRTVPALVAPPLAFDFAVSAVGEVIPRGRLDGMSRGHGVPHPGAAAAIGA